MENNREYKFRGKCKSGYDYSDGDGWIYGSLLYKDGEYAIVRTEDIDFGNSCDDGYSNISDFTCIPVIKETVGQYIGISINKEHPMYDDKIYLYEGDIFTDNEGRFPTKYVITFKNFKFVGISNSGDYFGKYVFDFSQPLRKDIKLKLLGNIHDNPELFK